jgi:hypothetical protein
MKKIEKGIGYFENIIYKQVGLMNQAPTNTRLLRHFIPRNDNVGLINQAPTNTRLLRHFIPRNDNVGLMNQAFANRRGK